MAHGAGSPVRGGTQGLLNPGTAAAALSAALFAGFLVVRVLFELAQQPALLKLKVKPLQSGVDRFVVVDVDVDQKGAFLRMPDYTFGQKPPGP